MNDDKKKVDTSLDQPKNSATNKAELEDSQGGAQPPHPVGRTAMAEGVSSADAIRDAEYNLNTSEDALRVKEALAKQPKVQFFIPLEGEEVLGEAYESVTINGYRIEIKKGFMVDLPKQVFEMLAEKYRVQVTAGMGKRLDRQDEKVRNALS